MSGFLRAAAVAALSVLLLGCLHHPKAPVVGPQYQTAGLQCFWLSNEGQGWVARPDVRDVTECRALDSCSGGEGLSGGGCYKWAAGNDAPPLPWPAPPPTPTPVAPAPQ